MVRTIVLDLFLISILFMLNCGLSCSKFLLVFRLLIFAPIIFNASENLVVFEANGAASSSSSSLSSSSVMLRAEEPEDDAAAGGIVRTRTYDLHIVYDKYYQARVRWRE